MESLIDVFDETWGRLDSAEPRRKLRGSLKLPFTVVTVEQFLAESARLHYRERAEAHRTMRNAHACPPSLQRAQVVPLPGSEDEAVAEALTAFAEGRIILFWNDRQVAEMHETLDLVGENEAVFVQLFPMKGG